MSDALPISALRTTFDIIETIANSGGMSLSELSEAMERPKSTVYDHIVTLRQLGYLVQRNGEYYISSDFLRMGDINRQNKDIYQAATDELEQLASETSEHASLVVEEHGKAVIIATVQGTEAIPVRIYDGIVMHMHTTAPGKAIFAFLDDDRISNILDHHGLVERTDNTITKPDDIADELAWIREHGYALDDEERLTGMRSVAAPVIDRKDQIRGSIALFGPTNRIDDDLFHEKFPDRLMRSSNIIEVLMNYNKM